MAAGDWTGAIWPLLCGMAKAKYDLLICAPLSWREAERIMPDDELLSKACEVAAQLAVDSLTALAFAKQSLNHWPSDASQVFEHSLALETLGFFSADGRQGLAALGQKRSRHLAP